MLNENRFLGTFRGHNTRTIFLTLSDGSILIVLLVIIYLSLDD